MASFIEEGRGGERRGGDHARRWLSSACTYLKGLENPVALRYLSEQRMCAIKLLLYLALGAASRSRRESNRGKETGREIATKNKRMEDGGNGKAGREEAGKGARAIIYLQLLRGRFGNKLMSFFFFCGTRVMQLCRSDFSIRKNLFV